MNKYTSLKLSKWLKDKGFKQEGDFYWEIGFFNRKKWVLNAKGNTRWALFTDNIFPSYDILNDLCIKYADQIFGGTDWHDKHGEMVEVLYQMYFDNKEGAEQYIMDNAILK